MPPSSPLDPPELAFLHRAIVSLPDALCAPRDPLDRIVFFESRGLESAGETLARLLATVWRIDTASWLDEGVIYNVCSARDLFDRHDPADGPRPLALFATGSGPRGAPGVAPNGVLYPEPAAVDLFVRPRVAQYLAAALDEVRRLRAADVARRSSGPRATR